MAAVISGVENHWSIFIVWLDLGDGRTEPVYMDRRAFGWMVEGEGIETVGDLIGRPVRYDSETIGFLESLEAA